MPTLVYRHRSGLYVNLTNRCPTACVFCIKNSWKMNYRGSDLDLRGAKPSPEEVIALAKAQWKAAPFEELVFCGYGEPTLRLDVIKEVARQVVAEHGACRVLTNLGAYQDSKHLHWHVSAGEVL